jgi:XTP/dITP diphosphohydrolase
MPPPPAPLTVVLATRNAHKVGELRSLLGDAAECRSLQDWPDAPAVIEDANTFAGNATKKAVQLARWLAAGPAPQAGLPAEGAFVLADDSGLEVDALGGAPGVQSARFAALGTGAVGNSPDSANNAKLLRLLADVPANRRTARFRCILALVPVSPDAAARVTLFDGACEGRLDFAPRGAGGFGYDPLFVPQGHDRTFAELGEETKNTLSHRAHALRRLHDWLARQPGSSGVTR